MTIWLASWPRRTSNTGDCSPEIVFRRLAAFAEKVELAVAFRAAEPAASLAFLDAPSRSEELGANVRPESLTVTSTPFGSACLVAPLTSRAPFATVVSAWMALTIRLSTTFREIRPHRDVILHRFATGELNRLADRFVNLDAVPAYRPFLTREQTRSMRTIGQLTASNVHAVNQPFAATLTNAEAALRWLDGQPPVLEEVRRALAHIVTGTDHTSGVATRFACATSICTSRSSRWLSNAN